MVDLNTLGQAEPLTGFEQLPLLQNGIWVLGRLADVLNLATPTIAAAPTAFAAVAFDESQIDLSWTGSADNYVLESTRGDSGDSYVQIYSGATASYSDTLLFPEETYYYRVKSQVTGEADSDWVLTNETTPAA
jgi:hypothetical protein